MPEPGAAGLWPEFRDSEEASERFEARGEGVGAVGGVGRGAAAAAGATGLGAGAGADGGVGAGAGAAALVALAASASPLAPAFILAMTAFLSVLLRRGLAA